MSDTPLTDGFAKMTDDTRRESRKGEALATLQSAINMTDGHVQEMLRRAYDGLSTHSLPSSHYDACPVCETPTRHTPVSETPPAVQGVSEDVQRFAIQVEKKLCTALGRPWEPSGFSIESLIADLKAQRSMAAATQVGLAVAEAGMRRRLADTEQRILAEEYLTLARLSERG